jgi:hypothetical protein
MNDYIFEVIDKTRRKIHLSKERCKHIREEHPELVDPEKVKKVITKPDKITQNDRDMTYPGITCIRKNKRRYRKVSEHCNIIGT